jgi:hypothetical protein
MRQGDPKLLVDASHFASRLVHEVRDSINSGSVERTRGEFTQWTLAVKIWLAVEAEALGFSAFSNHAGGESFSLTWYGGRKRAANAQFSLVNLSLVILVTQL